MILFVTIAVPTSKHMSYQATKFAPYWINRYVLRNKNARLEPLYHFEQSEEEEQSYVDEKKEKA